jgi:exosortase family protein XrtM
MPLNKTGTQSNLRILYQSYKKEIQFLFLFVLLMALLNFLYFLCGGTFVEDFVLSQITARPVFAIVSFLTPGEQAVLDGTHLTSPHVNFEIVRGCEGMEGILLLISAMLAFSIPWKEKLKGILYGLLFIYVFNLLRIVGLFYLVTYYSGAFAFAHLFVGQSIMVFLVAVFFMLWISKSMNKNEDKTAG